MGASATTNRPQPGSHPRPAYAIPWMSNSREDVPRVSAGKSQFEVTFAPQSAIPNKLVEKTRGKSTKKWRKMALYGAFSKAKSAILPCAGPAALDCNTLVCQALRSRSAHCFARRLERQIDSGAPFFAVQGTKRHI